VLFDINRISSLTPFMSYSPQRLIEALQRQSANRWTLTLVSNRGTDTPEVEARQHTVDAEKPEATPLPYTWPASLFSLSHVALPFPPDDPVYGYAYNVDGKTAPTLGNIQIKGERNVLVLPASELIRVRSNPFYDYIRQKIIGQLGGTE